MAPQLPEKFWSTPRKRARDKAGSRFCESRRRHRVREGNCGTQKNPAMDDALNRVTSYKAMFSDNGSTLARRDEMAPP